MGALPNLPVLGGSQGPTSTTGIPVGHQAGASPAEPVRAPGIASLVKARGADEGSGVQRSGYRETSGPGLHEQGLRGRPTAMAAAARLGGSATSIRRLEPVQHRVLVQGNHASVDANTGNHVITNARKLWQILKKLGVNLGVSPIRVDFRRERVVAVVMGSQASRALLDMQITSVARQTGTTFVYIKETPLTEPRMSAVEHNFYTFVAIPRNSDAIKFVVLANDGPTICPGPGGEYPPFAQR